MWRWFDDLGYRLCLRGSWIYDRWAHVWFRWRCPHPIISDRSARACIAAGHCGCDNKR